MGCSEGQLAAWKVWRGSEMDGAAAPLGRLLSYLLLDCIATCDGHRGSVAGVSEQ